jgi:hypothetical protein
MTWDFLQRWYMPFIYITACSIIAVPVSAYAQFGMELRPGSELGLAYGQGWVLRDELLASMIPYLLNLGAGIWLFNADGTTRWAAFWAMALGISRIIVPVWLLNLTDVMIASQHYIDWHTMRFVLWFQDVEMFFLGIMVWGVFSRFAGNGEAAGGHAAYYAEA